MKAARITVTGASESFFSRDAKDTFFCSYMKYMWCNVEIEFLFVGSGEAENHDSMP